MWLIINESLSDICSSPFWDMNVMWNSPDPDFTPCFEKTVLVWFPCLFLWLFLPLEVYYQRSTRGNKIPFNPYNISKLVFIALLVTLAFTDIVSHIFFREQLSPVEIYSAIIKCSTFCLFFALTLANIQCGIRSSGVLFIFSLLLAFFGAPQFRTVLRVLSNSIITNYELVEVIPYIVYYSLVLTILFLNVFSDASSLAQKGLVDKNKCPESRSSFLSRIFFAWFDGFAWTGYRRSLNDSDLWNLDYKLESARITREFESKWYRKLERAKKYSSTQLHAEVTSMEDCCDEDQKIIRAEKTSQRETSEGTIRASVIGPLCAAFGPYFVFGVVLKIVHDILTFVNPLILKAIIAFVEDKSQYLWRGYFYAFALLTVATVQALLSAQYSRFVSYTGLRVRTALLSAIYKKILQISSATRRDFTMGEIVNLVTTDAPRFIDLIGLIDLFWSIPLLCLAVFFLFTILGPSVFAGLAVIFTVIAMNAFIGFRVKTFEVELLKNKDNRLKLMNEILSGIKILKLYAWEPSFEKQVMRFRNEEIKLLRWTTYCNIAAAFLWTCTPFLVTAVTFAVYVLSSDEHVLDAQTAFVSLSLFGIVRAPLAMIPLFVSCIVQAAISTKRLNRFLNSEELDSNAVSHERTNEPIIIEKGNFSWEGFDGMPTLRNINFNVKPTSLVAVVGPVGSGKSSLLSALLGEMYKQSGLVNTTGSLAYVPQEAWIRNATVENNITFGDTSNRSFYKAVIKSCALITDLTTLPGGDQAEIGEQGINLSGGQKQRISLARAVFARADIYLLDDPLSAVDSSVGKHIFEHVIGPNGLLKGKTRVMTTHNVTYLPQFDHIIVLKDGTISESGTYDQLIEKKGDFAEFLATYSKESNDNEDDSGKTAGDYFVRKRRGDNKGSSSSRQSSVSETDLEGTGHEIVGQKLIEIEKVKTGNVTFEVYAFYLRAVGPFLVVVVMCMSVLFQVFSLTSNYWLSLWTSDKTAVVNGRQNSARQSQYLRLYGLSGLGQACTTLLMATALCFGLLKAARNLHNDLLKAVIRWPLFVFERMPIGRILNRFSSDIDVLDSKFQNFALNVLQRAPEVISILLAISFSTPSFIPLIVPVGIIYFVVQRFYIGTTRQLRRMEYVSRSPLFSHFKETVSGVQTIRAYGLQEKFIRALESKVDYNSKIYFADAASVWWLTIRLEMVGNLIIFFAVLFAVLDRDTLSGGLVGLSISYAFEITRTLYYLVRMVTEVETHIISLERIKEYGEIEQEAPWETSDYYNVPAGWPREGHITLLNFQVRYRKGLDLALKGITFHVNGGEKVGIVGRTGAGKSSLTMSLFRIIEAAEGKILIDDVDISKIGLHTLRRRLTIIPQDPILFSGSLRINLDPTEEYADEKIWNILELVGLKAYVSSLSSGLRHNVNEGGDNFSVGQRQLLCLARALLRKTKILILDEATAAVDLETDDCIQTTIRKEFKDCTVLTIAHRLNTIMDYDRIIVLDRGRIVEFDSPNILLKTKQSVFHGMAADAGLI